MNAARYRFRCELRAGGWRFVVATALLLGLVGGAALLAGTGARRTASAFERLETATSAAHVMINPDSQDVTQALPLERVLQIEGVDSAIAAEGVVALFDGELRDPAVLQPRPGTSWFTDIDRPVVLEGRLPDQSRPDELFANPEGARSAGMEVGDSVDLTVVSADELQPELQPELLGDVSPIERIEQLVADGVLGQHTTVRLVGIGITAADAVPGGELDAVYLTRAFSEQAQLAPQYGGIAVRLRNGTDGVDDFIAAVRKLVPTGSSIDFQTLASDRATVHRAVTPQVIALAVIAGVLALGSVLAVGQALGRRAAQGADDDAALAGLGMTRSERRMVDMMRLVVVSGIGTTLAIGVAASASPATPIGLAREIEPSPGWSVDVVALLIGGGVLAVSALVIGALFTIRARQPRARAAVPSTLAAWLRAHSVSEPLSFGVGLALEPGRGRTSASTRSTLATAAGGVAAVIASLTFATSLEGLLSSPRDYGSNFDALVQGGDLEGRERVAFAALATLLDESPLVAGWSQLYTEQIALPGGVVAVNAVGFEKSDNASPTLVEGRFPNRSDEIALGATTMRREGVGIGDRLDVTRQDGADAVSLVVVGKVVLPGVASYQASDQAALGVGAMLSLDGLASLTGAGSYGRPESSDSLPTAVLVTLREGTTPGDLRARLASDLGSDSFTVDGPVRSSDIASLERVRTMPALLASLLGVVAAIAVAHALAVAVRRRRRDLAILRTVGFTPTQVSHAVAWQATTVAVVAVGVGVPIGLLVGRVSWGAVARQLGIVNHPVTPTMAMVLALPLTIVFANLVALGPGWRAARSRPADILRAE